MPENTGRSTTGAGIGGDHGHNADLTKESARQIRVLVVMRQPIVRCGLAAIIAKQPDLEVVGTAANCAECCHKASLLAPDVLLCDLETEDNCAGECLSAFRQTLPTLPTIVMHQDIQHRRVMGASRLGVQGYLTTDTDPENLFRAIRAVSRGGTYLDQGLQSTLLDLVGGKNNAIFNRRESEILRLLSEGKSNQDIADELFVSKSTVKYHVSTILAKLKASNRTEAVRIALARGLV